MSNNTIQIACHAWFPYQDALKYFRGNFSTRYFLIVHDFISILAALLQSVFRLVFTAINAELLFYAVPYFTQLSASVHSFKEAL